MAAVKLLLLCTLHYIILLGNVTNGESGEEFEVDCNHRSLEGKTIWNCSDSGDFDFPKVNVPSWIQILDFSLNHISRLPVIIQEHEHIENCSGEELLREVYLHHNKIEELPNDAFQGLKCLKILDLSFNHLTGDKITPRTFQGLHSLKSLNLRGNPLGLLKDASLLYTELNSIEFADISQCELKTIENGAFDHLRFLKNLNLSHNSLSEVEKEVFRGLNFLNVLDLSQNKLTHISNQTFYATLALHSLYLESNNLLTVQAGAFDGLARLLKLSLKNNRLSKLPYEAFRPLRKSLKELDLSNNFISSLTGFKTDFTTNVEVLKLDEMSRLQTLGKNFSQFFPHICHLYIRRNPILKSIAKDAFKGNWDNMVYVDISNNKLESIHKDTFPWKQLTQLKWSGNPWNCDCYLKWLVTLHAVNKSLICHSPTKFKGHELQELHPLDLKCPRSMMPVLLGVFISLISIILSLAVFFSWRYRNKCKMCHPKGGKYISVYTNDGADDDAKATILPIIEEGEIREEQV